MKLKNITRNAFVLAAAVCVCIAGCDQQPPSGDADAPESAAHTHAVVTETCFICDPAKRDAGRLWCTEHGRYEDRCFLCHPEIEERGRLYCEEHFLYEDECFLCHPELLDQPAADQRNDAVLDLGVVHAHSESSDVLAGLYCNEHRVNENDCGICHPELLANLDTGEGLKVRFASVDSTRKAGVRTGFATEGTLASGIEVLGELTYNRNSLAVISPYAGGVVKEVLVDVGQSVETGDLLAVVSSPAIADAKGALVKSLVDAQLAGQAFNRERDLLDRQATSKQDYENARATQAASTNEVDRARQQLLNLGLSDHEIAAIEKSRSTSSELPLRAPFPGVVIERNAVAGAAVETGAALLRVADLSTMWLELSVPAQQAVRLLPNAPVRVEFDAFLGESFTGEVTWIASEVDVSTRTVQARAVLANPAQRLKSGLFGRAQIADALETTGITAPREAVQIVDGRPVVFAKLEDDLYETRIVRTGSEINGRVAILDGLASTDEIALTEGFILKSELLKARLGAGCVHE